MESSSRLCGYQSRAPCQSSSLTSLLQLKPVCSIHKKIKLSDQLYTCAECELSGWISDQRELRKAFKRLVSEVVDFFSVISNQSTSTTWLSPFHRRTSVKYTIWILIKNLLLLIKIFILALAWLSFSSKRILTESWGLIRWVYTVSSRWITVLHTTSMWRPTWFPSSEMEFSSSGGKKMWGVPWYEADNRRW